jgi:hypothetical protein
MHPHPQLGCGFLQGTFPTGAGAVPAWVLPQGLAKKQVHVFTYSPMARSLLYFNLITSQPSSISLSASPSSSFISLIERTSSDLTSWWALHWATHSTTWVVCTDNRDRVCESKSRPRLNSRSTSIEVANNS